MKIFQQAESSLSYAWTSVALPGPQHTVQQKFRNKATFTLNQLEIEVDYQVQVQAKNAFGWGKVSEQFTFRTSKAGESQESSHIVSPVKCFNYPPTPVKLNQINIYF